MSYYMNDMNKNKESLELSLLDQVICLFYSISLHVAENVHSAVYRFLQALK